MNIEEAKLEALKELTVYLRSKRQSEPKRWDFVNKPFFITLIGVVFVSVVSLIWEGKQNIRAQAAAYQTAVTKERIDSVKRLYIAHHDYFQIQDTRFQFTTHYGLVKADKNYSKRTATLTAYRKKLNQLNRKIETAGVPISTLQMVRALFASNIVQEKAERYEAEFKKTVTLINQITAYLNSKQSLEGVDIPASLKEYNDQKLDLDNSLNLLRQACFAFMSDIEGIFELGMSDLDLAENDT